MINKPDKIVLHHTGGILNNPRASTQWHTVAMIDDEHRRRWPDFKSQLGYWAGYHFIITSDGVITQTRNVDEEGAHTRKYNLESIGICLIGNFTKGVDRPTESQIISLKKLLDRFSYIKKIVGHRDLGRTDCPGTGITDAWIQGLRQVVNPIAKSQISIMLDMLAKMLETLKKMRFGKQEIDYYN